MKILRISRAKRSRERTIFRSEGATPERVTAAPRPGLPWGGVALCVSAALLLSVAPVRGQEAQEAAAEVREAATETPEGTTEHRVKKGDTLWDLAGHYLTDPFAWRAIYELNGEKIEDPHWIFPGQVFLLPPGMELQRDAGEANGAETAAADGAAGAGNRGTGPATAEERAAAFDNPSVFTGSREGGVDVGELAVSGAGAAALVSPSDFYRVGFVAPLESLGPMAKVARVMRENPLGLQIPPGIRPGDRIMLDSGGLQLARGDVLQAVRMDRKLSPHGTVLRSLALVEVTAVEGDSARASVARLYGDFQIGDPLIRAESFSSAEVGNALAPARGELTAELIGFETEQPLLSTGDAVYLDVGREDGVRPGDEFAFFSRSVPSALTAPAEDRLSVVRVVRVRSGTATARVVETRDVGTSEGAPGRRVRQATTATGG